MVLRLMLLLSVLSVIGLRIGPSTSDAPEPAEEREMGGEGFGRMMERLGVLGAVLLAIMVILAVLSLSGVFDAPFADPEA